MPIRTGGALRARAAREDRVEGSLLAPPRRTPRAIEAEAERSQCHRPPLDHIAVVALGVGGLDGPIAHEAVVERAGLLDHERLKRQAGLARILVDRQILTDLRVRCRSAMAELEGLARIGARDPGDLDFAGGRAERSNLRAVLRVARQP